MVVIEYKTTAYPYHYVYLGRGEDNITTFRTKADARKKCMSLIRTHKAIVAFLRPFNEGVYHTKEGSFILEKRIMIDGRERSFWYILRKDGNLGKHISDIHDWHLIQSAY